MDFPCNISISDKRILRLTKFSAESENLILRSHTDKGTSLRLMVSASLTNTRYVISYRSCRYGYATLIRFSLNYDYSWEQLIAFLVSP